MSHRYGLTDGVSLSSFSANANSEGYVLLLRVVKVNDNGTLTLPVREIWCSNQQKSIADAKINYLVYAANTPEDDQEDYVTLDEANQCLSTLGQPWLRSLETRLPFVVAGTGRWFVTALVRGETCIWDWSGSCYIINEEGLVAWLDGRPGSVDIIDYEEDWWCLTHDSSDEAMLEARRESQQREDTGDENMGDGGMSLLKNNLANVRLRVLNFSLVSCDADNTDDGYNGDDEKGHF